MRRFTMWAFLIILLVPLSAPSGAWGQASFGGSPFDGPPEIPMRLFASQDGIAPGEKMRVAVVYDIPADHHIQQNEFLFAQPLEGEPFTLGPQILPPSRSWEGEPIFIGKIAVLYDLALAAGTPLGARALKFRAGYQHCSERPSFACFPPDERDLTLDVNVVAPGSPVRPTHASLFPKHAPPEAGQKTPEIAPIAPAGQEGSAAESTPEIAPQAAPSAALSEGSTAAPPAGEGAPGAGVQEGLAGKLREALARGSWIAFLLVFLAGFLTSFTPCVYPMIPITIGYVAGASRGRLSGFILSLFFVLGIAIVYSVLGIAAALSGGVFGAALQSTAALIVIASIFILMAISMLGAFDITLPSAFQTKLQSGKRGGPIGAVVMGGVTGLVASPCVGPVLVVLLTWVAQVGRPIYGFGLLFTFALGLGVLFLILGTFVGAIQSLPRAGVWMESVKHYFGWIFLALAVYYLRHVIGPDWAQILYGVLLVLFAAQVGAFSGLSAGAGKGEKWHKGIGIVLAVFGIVFMASGLMAQQGWKRIAAVATGGQSPSATSTLPWRTDQDAALAQARASGKPVLIDFTADWCAACHELDKLTWSDPEVAGELGRFVILRLDMTRKSPETAAIDARWSITGLPTVILLDSAGNEVQRFFGFRPASEVLPLLRGIG